MKTGVRRSVSGRNIVGLGGAALLIFCAQAVSVALNIS